MPLSCAILPAGATCAGLTSFGPAVYAIADGDCRDIEAAARQAMSGVGGDILISHARNEGAQLRVAC